MLDRIFYLYKHIRLDNNQIFYVGIGHYKESIKDLNKGLKYKRAHAKTKRNNFWNHVVNKTKYKVEIILELDDYDIIRELEKDFIKLYGRRDKGLGELVNLTDGGDGSINVYITDEIKEKRRIRMKNYWIEGKTNLKNNSKLVFNTETGIYYNSLKEAADTIETRSNVISRRIESKTKKHTNFILA